MAAHADDFVAIDVVVQCVRLEDSGHGNDSALPRFMGGTVSPTAHATSRGTAVVCFEEAPLFSQRTTCVCGPESVLAVPPGLSLTRACAALPALLRAAVALYFRVPPETCRGSTILVLDGETPASFLSVQIAARWGADNVLVHCRRGGDTTACKTAYASALRTQKARHTILGDSPEGTDIFKVVMLATGGAGVDLILQLATDEGEGTPSFEVLSQCLGIHGHICCARRFGLDSGELGLLDAGVLELLRRKGASLHTLCDDAWIGAPRSRGRLLHVLAELMDLLARGELVAPLVREEVLEGGPTGLSQDASLTTLGEAPHAVVRLLK